MDKALHDTLTAGNAATYIDLSCANTTFYLLFLFDLILL